MYIEGTALVGAVLTAIGVALLGAGSTEGQIFPRSEKRIGQPRFWEWVMFVGTVAGIVGAFLTVASLIL
ncbi:hypothetical protein ACIGH6_14170 [Brachybacterium paraconglomeratum]|uniref:hypothetical protein n=1 Tax=Brachybacterium paraconglomeratum TaxID=173362 RepID=UPI0037C5AEA4